MRLRLLLCLWLVALASSGKKARKNLVFQQNQLSSDQQVSIFLYAQQQQSFFYNSTSNNTSLTFTVTPCWAQITWTVRFLHQNHPAETFFTDLTNTSMMIGQPKVGVYELSLQSNHDSLVHLYISTELGGALALNQSHHNKLVLKPRHRLNGLSVRWPPTLVDPQSTKYCLVISTKQHYSALCSVPDPLHQSASKNIIFGREPNLICPGKSTHVTLSHLKPNQKYLINVFATNAQSNLSYLLARAETTYFRPHPKQAHLKFDQSTYFNLAKTEGRATARLKLRGGASSFSFIVIPCGGAVNIKIMHLKKLVVLRTQVRSFEQILIERPVEGARYYVKIQLSDRSGFGVELYATRKSSTNLPKIAESLNVTEYEELRTCSSVTIGFIPIRTNHKVGKYCFTVREGVVNELEDWELPNQCSKQGRKRPNVQDDYVIRFCRILPNQRGVLLQEISSLSSGKSYIIEIRQDNLTYDLGQVRTLSACQKE